MWIHPEPEVPALLYIGRGEQGYKEGDRVCWLVSYSVSHGKQPIDPSYHPDTPIWGSWRRALFSMIVTRLSPRGLPP
jgi:hypothetical protein